MLSAPALAARPLPASPAAAVAGALSPERLVREHFTFVWRSLRRLGLSPADADDAAQQVFLVASEKVEAIVPGCEKSFLFGVALRVVARVRRTRARRPEQGDDALEEHRDSCPGLDELLDQRRARQTLDAILASMGEDVRAVFVCYELEQLTMAEIARALGVPPGTVASRLRRAREHFASAVARLEAARRPGALP